MRTLLGSISVVPTESGGWYVCSNCDFARKFEGDPLPRPYRGIHPECLEVTPEVEGAVYWASREAQWPGSTR